MTATVVVHASGAARREAALAASSDGAGPLWVVGARIESARALAADLAVRLGTAVEIECTTLDGLAMRLARPKLDDLGRVISTGVPPRAADTIVSGPRPRTTPVEIATPLMIDSAVSEALAALAPTLPRMGPLRASPGMARAIGRTLDELWAADLAPANVTAIDAELAAVAAYVERVLAKEKLAPRVRATELAIRAVIEGALADARVVMLDVPITTRFASELAHAIAASTANATFTVPRADARTLGRLAGIRIVEPPSQGPASALAESLFGAERAPSAIVDTVIARSETAEAAEVARRVLAAARAGTPLHRIAIVLRKPELSRAALEAAFEAAAIPLAQRRGARRPDPSGRALLALLTCAIEGLSARAFSAYLAFGAMPALDAGAPPPASANRASRGYDDEEDEDDDETPVDEVRAPRRWESLLVEASVIGGDPTRWRRRLAGLGAELARRASELDRRGGESIGIRRERDELAALERFALPLLEDLAALPPSASLAVYADRIAAIATRALARPTRALAVLTELAPRAASSDVLTLSDVARLLAPRLSTLEMQPVRAGVPLLTPDELRGASFDVVILPTLVERVFPARVPEDPLLPDAARRLLSPDLEDAHARAHDERLRLALAVGAAEREVIALASTATAEARARVPSVYFVELLGRRLGRVASAADLAAAMERAVSHVGAPDAAARPSERTLARIHALAAEPRETATGRANDIVERNPLLRSSLARAWRLESPKLTRADGLVQSDKDARTPLQAHDPSRRPYSATALESFASCPLRFHFKAVLRLEPREEPAPLEEIDPLVRGSIFHEAQFLTLLALRDRGALPFAANALPAATEVLASVMSALRTDLVDRLVPAIPRAFHAALDAIEADLREWLARLVADPTWQPRYFELAFGLPEGDGRDPASRDAAVPLDEGLTLRGAIDLVEENAGTHALRATDHKTGSSFPIRGRGSLVVRGGQTLQPVLYALALTKLFGDATVAGGRLWYCTSKGRFEERTVPLDDEARAAAKALVAAIHEALSQGLLPATPLPGACRFCDYQRACGPHAASHAARIGSDELAARLPGLVQLRKRA